MGSFGLSEKGPLSVRISDRSGGLLQAIPADLAVKGAAANFETSCCLMRVPVGFPGTLPASNVSHSKQERWGGMLCAKDE